MEVRLVPDLLRLSLFVFHKCALAFTARTGALPRRRDPGLQLRRVVCHRHRSHFGGVSFIVSPEYFLCMTLMAPAHCICGYLIYILMFYVWQRVCWCVLRARAIPSFWWIDGCDSASVVETMRVSSHMLWFDSSSELIRCGSNQCIFLIILICFLKLIYPSVFCLYSVSVHWSHNSNHKLLSFAA